LQLTGKIWQEFDFSSSLLL